MKKYHLSRLTLGWQIMIGLVLGIVLGCVFYQNKTAITAMQNTGSMFISLYIIYTPVILVNIYNPPSKPKIAVDYGPLLWD